MAKVLDGRVLKAFKRGTHRIITPEETVARVTPYAPQMGITRIGNLTGLDRIGIPVTIAVRPNGRSFAVSQGKGLNLCHALASALMEATELFHGESLLAFTRLASFRELSAQARVVSPDALNGTGNPLAYDAEIPWIEGYDMLGGESCWVPWEIVHTDYTLPTLHSGEHFLSGTNGLAAGNHLLEALTAALCELVERDAVAIWNAKDIRDRARCRLDLASVKDEDCGFLLGLYEKANVTPRVWDVTSDIGLPAFVCDIPAPTDNPQMGLRRFRGAGCHANRAIALARALTEAAQIRLTYIAGTRDDLPSSDYDDSLQAKLGAALIDAASAAAEPRSFFDVPSHDTDDLSVDLQWELERLRSVGIGQVIAVDLTQPDLGIPVVRVVIPGLEWDCGHPNYLPGARARQASGRAR